jgi:hypothetical protein
MDVFLTEATVKATLEEAMDPGEVLEAMARGTDLLGRPHFAGKTDKRGILLRLSKDFEVKERQYIPLTKLDKKLKRFALVKGLFLSPPGETAFRTDKEDALFASEQEALKEYLEPEDSFVTLGMGRDPGLGSETFYFVAFTNSRLILARLSGKREVEATDVIPLDALESFEMKHNGNPVPIDRPAIASQDQTLFLKYKSGRERKVLITDMFGHRREDAPD